MDNPLQAPRATRQRVNAGDAFLNNHPQQLLQQQDYQQRRRLRSGVFPYRINFPDTNNAYRGIMNVEFPRFSSTILTQQHYLGIEQRLRNTFLAILDDYIQHFHPRPRDQIGISIRAPNLSGFVNLMDWRHFTMDELWDYLMSIIQSAETLDLSQARFGFVWAGQMAGGNYLVNCVDVQEFLNKKCIIRIDTRDERQDCFFQCMALATTADWYSLTKHNSKQKYREEQGQMIREMIGLHPGNETVGLTEEELKPYEDHYKLHINIVDFYERKFLTPFKPVEHGVKDVYFLFIANPEHTGFGHFHYITKVNAVFNRNAFCRQCRKAYMKSGGHKCIVKQCTACRRQECLGRDIRAGELTEECVECHMLFYDENCLEQHQCGNKQRCWMCGLIMTQSQVKKHKCFKSNCKNCRAVIEHGSEHHCYIQPLVLSEHHQISDKYIFFDYECYTDQEGMHHMAMVCAMYLTSSEPIVFWSQESFMDWLLQQRGFTLIAHNGARYDSHFIKRSLLERGISSEDITVGNSFLSMTIFGKTQKKGKIRFIDSYRFIQEPLRNFPKIFGFDNVEKGYFPYTFLKEDTLDYIGPMPPIEHFCFENIKDPKEYEKALTWYDEHRLDLFNIKEIMEEYCKDDVLLLKQGCERFRRIFLDLTDEKIDPFEYVTIASACMAVYRLSYMPKNSIEVMQYQYKIHVERKAWHWIHSLSTEIVPCTLQLNLPGDPIIHGMSPNQQTLYLFLGCYDTGCRRCFNAHTQHRLRFQPMSTLAHEWNTQKKMLREQLYTLVIMKECDWDKLPISHMIHPDYIGRLNPRDAFYGGRSEPTKLLVLQRLLSYVDYNSLYPAVQHGTTFHGLMSDTYDQIHPVYYPIGHPEFFVGEAAERYMDSPHLYFGLIKCQILPPTDLYHPVLPYRCHGKLFFALCRTCTETYSIECLHADEERAFSGTWTTVEVEKARSCGYRLLKVYEVWHYQEKSTDLFRHYVETFMVIKLQARGKKKLLEESGCATIEEYTEQLFRDTGLQLDLNQIPETMNNGLYDISKRCLNSLWGKFGQRDNMGTTVDVFDQEGFEKIVFDDQYEINGVIIPTSRATTLSYTYRQDCINTSFNTNVVVCAFTTAYARLRLYEALEVLGDRVCYSDTDSIIYINDENTPKLHTGTVLGDLKDEISPGHFIHSYVSTGSKSYAYKTTDQKQTLKIKGITLSVENQDLITFSTLQDLIVDSEENETQDDFVMVSNMRFQIRPRESIQTIHQKKIFRKTFDKRYVSILNNDYVDTLPYGYRPQNE